MSEADRLLSSMDQVKDLVDSLRGLRSQLVADGWTDEQARDLIVAMSQINAKGARE